MSAIKKDALRAEYESRYLLYERANDEVKRQLVLLLADLSASYSVRPGLAVSGEPKEFDRFWAKAKKKRLQTVDECFERIGDVARARVVCETLDDCYRLVELLEKQETIYVDGSSIDDMIKTPTETGYRAIHLDVSVDVTYKGSPQSVKCELQIRSVLQEAWGGFTHSDFYSGKPSAGMSKDLMKSLSDLLHVADVMAIRLIDEITENG